MFAGPCRLIKPPVRYPADRYAWIARAACLPAPMARITVADPVTMSPPAKTPGQVVSPDAPRVTMYPRRFVSSPGVVAGTIGLAAVALLENTCDLDKELARQPRKRDHA